MERVHAFLFKPGQWLGEGVISFNHKALQQVPFKASWVIKPIKQEIIDSEQIVQMEGTDDYLKNRFQLYALSPKSFKIVLENDIVGKVMGEGLIEEKSIAWEFRNTDVFQGYEIYERMSDTEYAFHAEYASIEQFRTIIDGRIRLHSSR